MSKLRWGMVGGGPNSIGRTHRLAAGFDGHYELVAGVFSRDAGKNAAMGKELGIAEDRLYPNFEAMAAAEAKRPDGIECVSVITPNSTHVPACFAFLGHDIPVICDKPIGVSSTEAIKLMREVDRRGSPFALTHNYSAYTMVREAQHLVRSGRLGKIRIVQVEYALGSRSSLVEAQGDARFAWRADPAIGGPSTVLGDIGTHAHHLMRAVTGLELEAVSADLGTMVPGRKADDNANVNLRFVGGARGQLWASMVACGIGQGLNIRVFGEQASLEWHQEHPNELHLRFENQPNQILRRGDPWLSEQAKRGVRTNRGQPEGYVSAFANIYRDFAEVLAARKAGRRPDPLADSFASARDGVLGMIFIEAAVESSRRNGAWVEAGEQRLGAAA
jgi:predicted dehydrogenase